MAGPDEAVLVTDATWQVLYGNVAACRLLGCTPAELQGMPMRDTYPSSDIQRSEEVLRELQEGHALRLRRRLRRRDGEYILVDIHWQVLDDGRYRAMIRPASPQPDQSAEPVT